MHDGYGINGGGSYKKSSNHKNNYKKHTQEKVTMGVNKNAFEIRLEVLELAWNICYSRYLGKLEDYNSKETLNVDKPRHPVAADVVQEATELNDFISGNNPGNS